MSRFTNISTRYGVTITVEDGDEEIRLALTSTATRNGIEAYLAPDEIHALAEALQVPMHDLTDDEYKRCYGSRRTE